MNAAAGVVTRGFVVSAAWRSSGKTTVTAGLAAAARERGITVQCFKKGPDYIDPQWLQLSSDRPCYNLDPWLQTSAELLHTYKSFRGDAGLVLVEGNMGLHDGMSEDGCDSTAGLALQLNLPVILVVDCRGMHRTVAALLDGLCRFDERVQFAGVILNCVAGARHEQKLRSAIESRTSLRVLGALPHDDASEISERELGLTPAPQQRNSVQYRAAVAALLERGCDLDALLGGCACVISPAPTVAKSCESVPLRIGIAQDEAFHFYYQDDLAEFRRRGIELIPLSPLCDNFPDDLHGLLIGGGFPERFARRLSDNKAFRVGLQLAIADGLPVHAECAGLMYLCRQLQQHDRQFPMVGAIAADVRIRTKPVGRGYMRLSHTNSPERFKAHEFHYSELFNTESLNYCFRVDRGHGVDGARDGIVVNNTVASYAHFRHTAATPWIDWFLQRVARNESQSGRHYVQA